MSEAGQYLMQQKPSKPAPLSREGQALRQRAARLPEGSERDGLLREADRLDHAARMNAYLTSKELEPPT